MTGITVLWGVALAFAAAAAIWDLRTGHIPNRLTLGGLALGSVLHALVETIGREPSVPLVPADVALVVAASLAGALMCGAVPYFLFMRGAMGGGDVKLLAALGALLGPVSGLQVELYAFIAVAIFVPARLAYEGRLLQMLGQSFAIMLNPALPRAWRREVDIEQLTFHKFGPAVLVSTLGVAILRWRGL